MPFYPFLSLPPSLDSIFIQGGVVSALAKSSGPVGKRVLSGAARGLRGQGETASVEGGVTTTREQEREGAEMSTDQPTDRPTNPSINQLNQPIDQRTQHFNQLNQLNPVHLLPRVC